MDKRSERMLEDILKLPGNERCADCKAAAPRWASVNLGIFLCVGCASVHRKLGTHKSRVKSVTLDTWSREQLAAMRQMGNTASNHIFNPDERRNPPPTSSSGSDDRDGELEKFIRRKYEQGAFKAGASAGMAVPNSMNRARAAAGKPELGMVRSTSWTNSNARNPELNDLLVGKEKDLPRLPKATAIPAQHSGPSQPPRSRPVVSRGNTPQPTGSGGGGNLIDMGEGVSATMPLQMTGYAAGPAGNQGQGMGGSWNGQPAFGTSPFQPGFSGTSPFQQPQFQQQYQTQQSMSSGYPSYQSPPQQFQQPQQFSPPYPQSHFPPQMGYQQFLPIPQQHGVQLGTSPTGMGYGQGSPGQMQSPQSWQGMSGMGTVYGQGR